MKTMELRNAQVHVSDDENSLVRDLADKFCLLAAEAISSRGRFTVALSGGSTPRALYEQLATPIFSNRLNWTKIFLFMGDERCVPREDSENNFKMVRESMLVKVPILDKNVFPTKGQDKDPERAAADYCTSIRTVFGISENEAPEFDLILLGLGPDGHTASLFPDSKALQEQDKLMVVNWVEKFNSSRLTFTYRVINNARNVIFLVSGAAKADIVHEVFTAQDKYPAQRVQPKHGKLFWYVDKPAAAKLGG